MKATNNGSLLEIPECYILVHGDHCDGGCKIPMNNLPDLSDSKTAVYNSEAIIGRSVPLYTYSHSGDRTISLQLHFFVINKEDAKNNLDYLRLLQSALYPRIGGTSGAPFKPPPLCQIKCGFLLSGNPKGGRSAEPLCCVLQSCSVKFPTEVVWDEETFCPFKFDVETTWLVAYNSEDLPFQHRIFSSGR